MSFFLIKHFNCSGNKDSVFVFQVGDNDLVYISHKAFSGLIGLEDLTIERCNLTSISGQTLSYLRNLVTLRLRHLSISALEDQNFRKLSALRGLEIDNWPYLEYISPLSFQGLNLSWLFITNTNITSVPSASFRNLAYLTSLNLSYNPISVLESWAFRDLIRFVQIFSACFPACHVTISLHQGNCEFTVEIISSPNMLEQLHIHNDNKLYFLYIYTVRRRFYSK